MIHFGSLFRRQTGIGQYSRRIGMRAQGRERRGSRGLELTVPHVAAHGEQTGKRRAHRLLIARRQQVGEVADGDPHPVKSLGVFDAARDERAGRRHVPHHRQGPEFGMQRQGQLPIHHQFADRRTPGRFHDMPRNALAFGFAADGGIVGIEEHLKL